MEHEDLARARQHWEAQRIELDPDTFLGHPLIQTYVSIQVAGRLTSQLGVALPILRERTLPGARILSLACGTAGKEIEIARVLSDRHVVGVDLTATALSRVRSELAARGITNVELVGGDCNDLDLEQDSFDVVVGFGAFHHIENLEGMWAQVKRALRPDGFVLGMEYVGPNRLHWTETQCRLGTELLRSHVPDAHKVHHKVVEPVPLEEMLAVDPSEAVRSAEILPTCEAAGFRVTDYRSGGCGLLLPMLIHQAHTFDPFCWEHNRLLAELFAIEQGYMADDVVGDINAVFVVEP